MQEPDPGYGQHPILVGAQKCLEILFPDEVSRPAIRTFREWQARGYFPYFKIGRRTFFNPVEVHAALARRFRIQARLAPWPWATRSSPRQPLPHRPSSGFIRGAPATQCRVRPTSPTAGRRECRRAPETYPGSSASRFDTRWESGIVQPCRGGILQSRFHRQRVATWLASRFLPLPIPIPPIM